MLLKNITTYIYEHLHLEALALSSHFKRTEAELISVLEEIDSKKVYLEYGYASLYQYVIAELGLSESVTYNFITVMRKSREVPALLNKISSGEITLSNARKIAPVLTEVNQSEWLPKASALSQRKLDKEIVKVRPKAATPERTFYVTEKRLKVELGLSEDNMLKLRKVQDLVSQSRGDAADLEQTVVTMIDFYLKQKDPVQKATRIKAKKGLQIQVSKQKIDIVSEKRPTSTSTEPVALQVAHTSTPAKLLENSQSSQAAEIAQSLQVAKYLAREPLPAHLLHQVNLRDQRKCTFAGQNDKLCGQSRWVEIHHIQPVAKGGKNELQNLVTLCSAHHKLIHRKKK